MAGALDVRRAAGREDDRPVDAGAVCRFGAGFLSPTPGSRIWQCGQYSPPGSKLLWQREQVMGGTPSGYQPDTGRVDLPSPPAAADEQIGPADDLNSC
jgi:hypothetical protein